LTFNEDLNPIALFNALPEEVRRLAQPPQGAPARLSVYLFARGNQHTWHQFTDAAGCHFQQVRPHPWRRLEVEVTPDGVEGFWEGRSLGKVLTAQWADCTERMLTTSRTLNPPAPYPPDLRPVFNPRGSLGLFVYQSSASFQDVVIEPLNRSEPQALGGN
jgi:hypothetical protein